MNEVKDIYLSKFTIRLARDSRVHDACAQPREPVANRR